jgi:hypothetical protein
MLQAEQRRRARLGVAESAIDEGLAAHFCAAILCSQLAVTVPHMRASCISRAHRLVSFAFC